MSHPIMSYFHADRITDAAPCQVAAALSQILDELNAARLHDGGNSHIEERLDRLEATVLLLATNIAQRP